jgi:hypothetical protein
MHLASKAPLLLLADCLMPASIPLSACCAVYDMIETLLPEAGKAVKPKLLELNLCDRSCSPRPGWIMVVNEP